MIFLKKLDTIPFGKYSPRNKPVAMANGVEISKASNDVSKVPIKNGKAP